MKIISLSPRAEVNAIVTTLQQDHNLEMRLIEITGETTLPVKQIIVSDSDDEIYAETVKNYSYKNGNVTNEKGFIGVAKTLNVKNGDILDNLIIIKDYVVVGLAKYIANRINESNVITEQDVRLANVFFHELGHAVFSTLILEKFGYYIDAPAIYDLRTQAREYYINQSICLFEEYCAQSYADQFVHCCSPLYDDETIQTHFHSLFSAQSINEHAQLTAYIFAIQAAYYDIKNEQLNLDKYTIDRSIRSALEIYCKQLKLGLNKLKTDNFDFHLYNMDIATNYMQLVKAEDISRAK